MADDKPSRAPVQRSPRGLLTNETPPWSPGIRPTSVDEHFAIWRNRAKAYIESEGHDDPKNYRRIKESAETSGTIDCASVAANILALIDKIEGYRKLGNAGAERALQEALCLATYAHQLTITEFEADIARNLENQRQLEMIRGNTSSVVQTRRQNLTPTVLAVLKNCPKFSPGRVFRQLQLQSPELFPESLRRNTIRDINAIMDAGQSAQPAH